MSKFYEDKLVAYATREREDNDYEPPITAQ